MAILLSIGRHKQTGNGHYGRVISRAISRNDENVGRVKLAANREIICGKIIHPTDFTGRGEREESARVKVRLETTSRRFRFSNRSPLQNGNSAEDARATCTMRSRPRNKKKRKKRSDAIETTFRFETCSDPVQIRTKRFYRSTIHVGRKCRSYPATGGNNRAETIHLERAEFPMNERNRLRSAEKRR